MARADAEFMGTLTAARSAVKSGQLAIAANILEGWLALSDGTRESPIVQLLGDIYFYEDKPADAFAVLGPRCHSGSDPELLLRGSLASLRRGSLSAGQRAFAVAYVRAHWTSGQDNWRQDETVAGTDAVTCLALGLAPSYDNIGARYYLGEALRLDPGSPAASFTLGNLELASKRYKSAATIYRAGLSRSDSRFASIMAKRLADAEYLHKRFGT